MCAPFSLWFQTGWDLVSWQTRVPDSWRNLRAIQRVCSYGFRLSLNFRGRSINNRHAHRKTLSCLDTSAVGYAGRYVDFVTTFAPRYKGFLVDFLSSHSFSFSTLNKFPTTTNYFMMDHDHGSISHHHHHHHHHHPSRVLYSLSSSSSSSSCAFSFVRRNSLFRSSPQQQLLLLAPALLWWWWWLWRRRWWWLWDITLSNNPKHKCWLWNPQFFTRSPPLFSHAFCKAPSCSPGALHDVRFRRSLMTSWGHKARDERVYENDGEPWWRQVHLPTRKARVKFHPSLYQRHPVIEKQQTILILSYGYYHYHVWSQSQWRR